MKKWLVPHLAFLKTVRGDAARTVVGDAEYNEQPDAVRVSKMKETLQGTNFRLMFTDAALADILKNI